MSINTNNNNNKSNENVNNNLNNSNNLNNQNQLLLFSGLKEKKIKQIVIKMKLALFIIYFKKNLIYINYSPFYSIK